MKSITCTICIILNSLILFSQNLVPNPSFETYKFSPDKSFNDNELSLYLNDWISPTVASPDFYVYTENPTNKDPFRFYTFGDQKAYDGNVFVGLLLQVYFGEYISYDKIYIREYVQAKLLKPLLKGHKYHVSMYYKLSERCSYAIDGLEIYFSKEKITSLSYLLDYKPQISNRDGNILTNCQWNKLEGYFIADKRMDYITIGNFKRYNQIHFKQVQPRDSIISEYAYYLIDKIEVFEVNKNDSTPNFTDYNQKAEPIYEDSKKINNQADTLQLKNTIIKRDTLVLSDVLFEFGKATLLDDYLEDLNNIVQYLGSSPKQSIIIEGHTDSIGNNAVNLKLSLDRANSVAEYLINNGYDSSKIETVGFGESKPVSDNGTENGRARNRRVEIIFKKND
jgi:OmpA-OmpF porin, OOP family